MFFVAHIEKANSHKKNGIDCMENVREMKSITLFSAIVASLANTKEKVLHMLVSIRTESKFYIWIFQLSFYTLHIRLMTFNTYIWQILRTYAFEMGWLCCLFQNKKLAFSLVCSLGIDMRRLKRFLFRIERTFLFWTLPFCTLSLEKK